MGIIEKPNEPKRRSVHFDDVPEILCYSPSPSLFPEAKLDQNYVTIPGFTTSTDFSRNFHVDNFELGSVLKRTSKLEQLRDLKKHKVQPDSSSYGLRLRPTQWQIMKGFYFCRGFLIITKC